MHDKEWKMRDVTLCNVQNVHSSEHISSRTQSGLQSIKLILIKHLWALPLWNNCELKQDYFMHTGYTGNIMQTTGNDP